MELQFEMQERFYDNENGDRRNDECTVSEKDQRKHVEKVEERLHLAVVPSWRSPMGRETRYTSIVRLGNCT